MDIKNVDKCRLCDSTDISNVWDFGRSPLPNNFRLLKEESEQEYPLAYFKCNDCHSIQLKHEIDSNILFKDYNYESPPNLIPHFNEMSKTTSEYLGLKPHDLVLDIGSNNGILLKEYQKLGFQVYGIEPAAKIAEKARKNGVPTLSDYFNIKLAEYLNAELISPKLITCTNCFAHVPDLNNFIEGIKIVLANDGYFVFENAYLLNTIKNLDFGQAYFEHIFMHSITPLKKFFEKHGLELFKIEYNNVQMGSIRGYVRQNSNNKLDKNDSVWKAEYAERLIGLQNLYIYEEFIKEINSIKDALLQELDISKTQDKTISVYGWPAKMTLLNKYFGLEKYINYVIEESPIKVGKYCPGTKLEIKSLDYFKQNPTDYCIVGAYNFFNDITKKNEWYKGQWINPLKI